MGAGGRVSHVEGQAAAGGPSPLRLQRRPTRYPARHRALPRGRRARPAGAPAREQPPQPQFRRDQVGQTVQRHGLALGRRPERAAHDAGLDEARVREQRGVEEGDQVRQRRPQTRAGRRGGRGVGRGAPAGRQIVDAGAAEDRAQYGRPRARLDAEGFRQVPAGTYDLVVQVGRVQTLAADLRGLFQDPVVEGVAGECRPCPCLAGPLDRGGSGRRLRQPNRYFCERLPGEPARRRPGRDHARAARDAPTAPLRSAGPGRLASSRSPAAASRPVR